MDKYINVKDFSQMIYENFGRDGEYDYRDLIRILREQPTADVKEVVRGKWLHEAGDIHSSGKYGYCSNCGGSVFIPYFSKQGILKTDFDFCPNCGADMREDVR